MEASDLRQWDTIWNAEARDLCTALAAPLVGGNAPISVLLFQPGDPLGRVIYLDQNEDSGPNPIEFNPGSSFTNALYSEDKLESWAPKDHKVSINSIRDFKKTSDEKREAYIKGEIRRYPHLEVESAPAFHFKEGQPFRMIPCFPSPLFHSDQRWWHDLPRLGACYTVGDEMEKHLDEATEESNLTEKQKAENRKMAAERILLICAISAGNQVLNVRLENLLLDTNHNAFEIVKNLCREGWKEEGVLQRVSQTTFLVANLFFAHAFFFPRRTAVKILRYLGPDARKVFEDHGWPFPGYPRVEEDFSLDVALEDLTRDMMFLLHAAIRLKGFKANMKSPSQKQIFAEVLGALRRVIPLLCGRAVLVGSKNRDGTFQKTSEFTAKAMNEKHWEYVAIQPPDKFLSATKEVDFPALKIGTIRGSLTPDGRLNARLLMDSLTPIKRETGTAKKAWYRQKCVNVAFSSDKSARSDAAKNSYDWLGRYVKARCVLAVEPKSVKDKTR